MVSRAAELEINQEDAVQSMISPTYRESPISFTFNTIAYNGKYWLAGSSDIVRTKQLYTYTECIDLLNSYYDYSTHVKVLNGHISSLDTIKRSYLGDSYTQYDEDVAYLKGRVISSKTLQKSMISQCESTFKYLRETRKVRVPTIQLVGIWAQNYATDEEFRNKYSIIVPSGLSSYSYKTLHTLAKSTDGKNWKLIEENPFQAEVRVTSGNFSKDTSKCARVNGMTWNSTLSLWIAVGGRGAQKWNKNQYGGVFSKSNDITQVTTSEYFSYDDGNFYYTNSSGDVVYTRYSTDYPVVATSLDGETWKQYTIEKGSSNEQSGGTEFPEGNSVACSDSLTIVAGKNFEASGNANIDGTILTSPDCVVWTPFKLQHQSGESYIGMREARGIAYNGNLWVAVGKGTSGNELNTSIYKSVDGVTWTHEPIPSKPTGSFKLNSVAWNGSVWLAVGSFRSVYISEDGGYTWVVLDKPYFNGGVVSGFEDSNYEFNSVAWDGNFWIITGIYGIYRSQDTIVWEKIDGVGGFSVATTVPLPILGGGIQTTNSIIVGQGSPASVLRSNDDSKWYPQIFDVTQTNYCGNRQKAYSDVVWTGNYWIVVGDTGNGNYYNNIARSADGLEWTFPPNELVKCNAIAWNGSKVVVVGTRTTGHNIINAVSTDEGVTWTSGNLNNSIYAGNCIAWNGTLWVAGGDRGLATSTDGLSWTAVTNCPLNIANSVAWNGYVWVAVGVGKSHSIALSINGRYWYSANPGTNPFTRGNGVAWNRKQWIALGEGPTNTMATSVDGFTWTPLGNTTFGVSGKTISWTGTNWLAAGEGLYPLATSTDGTTWQRYELPITVLNRYANKTITLPYTGVDSPSVLTTVSVGSALVTNSTNSTIAAEEAAAKLAADAIAAAAAAAAEAATRLSSKNTAASYRIKFLFWKKTLYDQLLQLNSVAYDIKIQDAYPVEYILANSIYQKLEKYTTEGQFYYEKVVDPASSLSIVSANLQQLEIFNTSLTPDLLQFYNNSRFLFEKKIDAMYLKFVTDANTVTLINGWGYTTQNKNAVLADYTAAKTVLDSTRLTANNVFDTEITSITYTNPLAPSLLYNKALTDTVTVNGVTSTILSNITTTVTDLYSRYLSVDFGIIPFMNAVFNGNNVYNVKANEFVSNAIAVSANWRSVLGGTDRTAEINSAAATLYNKYLRVSQLPYYPLAWSGIGGMVNATSRSLKYFKILKEDYAHPAQYIPELNNLYTTLRTKLDTLQTTRLTAINYARNLRNTTVKAKLNDFLSITKTRYTEPLSIDAHIQTLCTLTYYSNSSYSRANQFANVVDLARVKYPSLYPLIRAVKFADAEAEDDGCIAPSTGWGGLVNAAADISSSETLSNNRIKLYTTTVLLLKLRPGYRVSFYKSTVGKYISPNPPTTATSSTFTNYRNKTTYMIESIGSNYIILNPGESILTEPDFPTTPSVTVNLGYQITVTLSWNFQLSMEEQGKQGLSGWTKYNETYYARQRLADYIRANFLSKEFLDFTETFTYDMMKSSIDDLTTTVDTLNSNSLFLEQTMNSIASQDLTDIQSKVIPVAEAYLDRLLLSVTEQLPSEADGVAFGGVSLNGSPTLSSMISSINTSYDSLTTAATVSLTGKTNNEIKTIVENAITYKSTISQIQGSNAYLEILRGIVTYKSNLQQATFHINHMEEQIARWTRMKAKAIQNAPFAISQLSDGNGQPFIAAILPTDSSYWTQRYYTSFYNPDTQTYQECTFNAQTQKVVTLPALDPTKFIEYAATSSYQLYDMVRFNNKIYECIKDLSSESFENTLLSLGKYDNLLDIPYSSRTQAVVTSLYIQGVHPTDTARWKRRRYPYVEFNKIKIEAAPENIPALNITDFLPYTPSYEYVQGSIVRSDDKIYICINDIVTTNKIKGVLPTNDNYWVETVYPIVVYNTKEVEASPTNLPALNPANYETYSATKTYYAGTFVKENSTIYELLEYTTTESLGKNVLSSLGSAPSLNQNNRWIARTYPVVFVSGSKIEATPGTFTALNINNYTTYSDSIYYDVGNYVKYNNKIYICTLKSRSSLKDVPVSNTEYWMKIVFPTVIYNGEYTELIPGTIPPIDPASVDGYRTIKRYTAGDIVSDNNMVYECTSSIPYGIRIKNIVPTTTSYWKERKYPYVVVGGDQIEADPDSGKFVQLNHLDHHRYSDGMFYYRGDTVAYNGNVYECTNVIPPLLQDSTIINIVPTNGIYWTKLADTLEITYKVEHWFPVIFYAVGKLVSYDGKVYRCETNSLNNIPSELGIHWLEIIDYASIQIPIRYSSGRSYGIGSVISYRESATDLPNNETHKLNFYRCSSTEAYRPDRYRYDQLFTTGQLDSNNDFTYQIQPGNWLVYTPKYGLPEDDPMRLPMFAASLRRRVAMEIEIPYGSLKDNVDGFDFWMKQDFKRHLTEVAVKPSNATSIYNSLEARGTAVCTAFDQMEAAPNMNIYTLVSKAYQIITDYLIKIKTKVDRYINKINRIKLEYFYNPGVQQKIYENPYKFMNPVAFAKTPPQKMFLDLGVGNIREMESEVYNGNQINYTMESIRTYYSSTNLIDALQEEIATLLLQAKCITGYNVLFAMNNSKTKHGARFPLLIDGWPDTYKYQNMNYTGGYGPYVNFEIPITNYDIGGKWIGSDRFTGTMSDPWPGTIVDLINELMASSIKPPEYCLGPSPLLEALTYESNNSGIIGLGLLAKGLVGLVASGFRNFVDPWQIVGAIDFVGQVVTNDYSRRILTFVPEGKWPSFNERANDVRAFKQLVNIERRAISDALEFLDEITLIGFLETVGKLLRLNQYDIDGLKAFDDVDDFVIESRTVSQTITIPEPPNPPADYVPPVEPDPPQLKTGISNANLAAEREQLRSMQRNLENRLAALTGGTPNASKYYVPIPNAEYQKTQAILADKPKVWKIVDMDAAGAGLRGTSTVKVSKSGEWNGAAKPSGPLERSPVGIVVNQAEIDSAIERRKVRRAEYKQAVQDARLRQAQRQIIIAQIEDARLREVQMTTAIDENDFKNAMIEAENDAVTADYKKQMTDHQEYMESLQEKRALAEERYQRAMQEYDRKLAQTPSAASDLALDIENRRAVLTQITNDIVDGENVMVVRRTTYESRLVTRPPMKNLLLKMIPPFLINQYDTIVSSVTTLTDNTAIRLRRIINQAVAPAASAARQAMTFLDNRPRLAPFANFIRQADGTLKAAKPNIIGALGPLMEVAGIVLQAWQDGAFEESERLE